MSSLTGKVANDRLSPANSCGPLGEHERVRLDLLEAQTCWLLLATSGIPFQILLLGSLAVANRSPDDHGLTTRILPASGFLLTAGVGAAHYKVTVLSTTVSRR